ncbi:unnamed protein product [Sphenostylis stenocarpa]|uniref:Uncharacterized protein n=1 Tax=Sphenostylis stenocarpa TaxID=92480 RepID=A0AA86S3D5_9FABA|nr:unnamed protein product [Sphenostylis stenocarpa]
MADDKEKGNEVDQSYFGEARDYHTLSVPVMFSGLNREREMSAMISALTHVVCGEEHAHEHSFLHQNIDNSGIGGSGGGGGDGITVTSNMPSGSMTPSFACSSYFGNSVLKRRREGDDTSDLSRGASCPAISTSELKRLGGRLLHE